MSNTVFVTGATGNIGSMVVTGLLAKGADVRALVESGLPIGAATLPKTAPKHAHQLALFEA